MEAGLSNNSQSPSLQSLLKTPGQAGQIICGLIHINSFTSIHKKTHSRRIECLQIDSWACLIKEQNTRASPGGGWILRSGLLLGWNAIAMWNLKSVSANAFHAATITWDE